MNRTLGNPQTLPPPPKQVKDVVPWASKLIVELQNQLFQVRDVLNTGPQGAGPNIASAPTITPTAYLHHVTGTQTITRINTPMGATAPLQLRSSDGYSLGPGGNIDINQVTKIPPNTYTQLVYHAAAGMWHVTIGSGPFTASSLTAHGVLVGEGTSSIVAIAPLGPGKILIGQAGADPTAGTVAAGTGISVNFAGTTITVGNAGVLSVIAGTGIGVSGATGNVTVSNTGVLTVAGTANQITSSGGQNPVLALAAAISGVTSITLTSFIAALFAALTPTLYANRPASPTEGMIAAFTDSTVATWGSTIAGSGSNHVLAWYNHSGNWTVIGA